jgi:hypothetical protein
MSIRLIKHVNVFGIIKKTTKCLNIEILKGNMFTYSISKIRKKMIDIREKKGQNLQI